MKLSKTSNKLMTFFKNHDYIKPSPYNKEKDETLKETLTKLYDDILSAYDYVCGLKKQGNYYDVSIKKIKHSSQITMSKNFDPLSIPEIIRDQIQKSATFEITYSFSLYGRKIKIHFVVEDDHINKTQQDMYNRYIDNITIWLFVLNKYGYDKCSKTFTVYLYFTSLEKKLPTREEDTLDNRHVNTAFTTSCPENGEIVIFRKEAWFKVFIHETFHNFALDFSDMDTEYVTKYILNIFKVSSNVNLFESYTEIWAEIINATLCSFFELKDKTNVEQFLSNSLIIINSERTFGMFQMVKVLDFMGLSYKDLHSNTIIGQTRRTKLYKENTNVLAYYVIKTILLNNYTGFLYWCKKHNHSLLRFNKTIDTQHEFCKFIENNYKTPNMNSNVVETEKLYDDLHSTKKTKNLNYILSNLRMSICEME